MFAHSQNVLYSFVQQQGLLVIPMTTTVQAVKELVTGVAHEAAL
jgi:hypothetical protein